MSKIFITAGSGFIARQIIATLLENGHEIVATARDPVFLQRVFPSIQVLTSDFLQDDDIELWKKRLENSDIVINVAGVLQECAPEETWKIHYYTPKVLFDACVEMKIKKVIQISALGINKFDSDYSNSKLAADNYLEKLPIESVVIRPSVVFGSGSYGGSSLFRGLAGFPLILPIPGMGEQKMQPIHIEDLAKVVVEALTIPGKVLMVAVGATQVTAKNMLTLIREWLGFKTVKTINIPMIVIQWTAKMGNLFRKTPFNTTSISMMNANNIASEEETNEMLNYIHFKPRGFEEALFEKPSQVQDRWHARLYFLKPLARYGVAFLWIWTAIVCLFLYPVEKSYALLQSVGVTSFWQPILLYSSSILDGILGFSMLFNYRLKLIANIQIAFVLAYTIVISIFLPSYWLEPLGPISKNIPVLILTLVILALESDR